MKKKAKKSFQKSLVKGTKIFMKKEKKKLLYFREQYRNPSEEEIKKKGQYGREWYKG